MDAILNPTQNVKLPPTDCLKQVLSSLGSLFQESKQLYQDHKEAMGEQELSEKDVEYSCEIASRIYNLHLAASSICRIFDVENPIGEDWKEAF